MNIQTIKPDFDKALFNACATHPMQSWEWGEARRAMGIDVVRVGAFSGQTLKNVFQVTFHPIPYTRFSVGYLPRSSRPSDEVLTYMAKEASARNCIFIKMEPYEKKSPSRSSSVHKIVQSKHPLFPPWTREIDLNSSEQELLDGMKSKTRYNIRLSMKSGVTVWQETTDAGFEVFIKLYFETCKRQQYYGHSYEYHKQIFDSLKNSLSHILIAYYKDVPLAAYHLMVFNGTAFYVYGGSSIEHRKLMVSNLLMWESLLLGKKLGAHTFDMWGSLGPDFDSKHDWAGFTRFKEGFGGRLVEYESSSDIVFKSTAYEIYNGMSAIRSRLLKARIL